MQTKTGTKRIIDECDKTLYRFSRVYGRELLDISSNSIKPGFAANTSKDNRLTPNEVEIYDVYFELPAEYSPSDFKAEIKAYYHKVGASGLIPLTSDEWIDLDKAKQLKLPIYKTAEYVKTVSSSDSGCNFGSSSGLPFIILMIIFFLYRKRLKA